MRKHTHAHTWIPMNVCICVYVFVCARVSIHVYNVHSYTNVEHVMPCWLWCRVCQNLSCTDHCSWTQARCCLSNPLAVQVGGAKRVDLIKACVIMSLRWFFCIWIHMNFTVTHLARGKDSRLQWGSRRSQSGTLLWRSSVPRSVTDVTRPTRHTERAAIVVPRMKRSHGVESWTSVSTFGLLPG